MAGLTVWYDQEGDLLEVTFDDAPAVLEEIDEDIFERRAADGRVVGFTVFNVSKHDRAPLTLPVTAAAAD